MEEQMKEMLKTGGVYLDLTVANNITTFLRKNTTDRSLSGSVGTIWKKLRTLKDVKTCQYNVI